jgi:hypothetical protein
MLNRRRPLSPSTAARLAAGLFSCLLLFTGVNAVAAEQTRESYAASVEPICKLNTQASDRYLKGVKSLVKNDRLAQASRNFTKAAAALKKAQGQLAAVPQPPADTARLTKWLSGIKDEVALMRTIAAKLKQGNKGKASSLAIKLQHNATATNNLVVAYPFNYCRIDPSKYT